MAVLWVAGSAEQREAGDGGFRASTRRRPEHHAHDRLQRIAWAPLALIAVAALVGLLGPGPLSWASTSTPDGVVDVEYSRFVRHIADTGVELRVQPDTAQPDTAQPDTAQPDTARVWISSDYLSGVNVQQVTPQPDSWTAVGDGVVLAFPTGGPDPLTVQIEIRPDDLFLLRGSLGVAGREPVEFWQFVYP